MKARGAGMRVKEIGEFGLIDRIRERLGKAGEGVAVPLGDDSAGVTFTPGKIVLASCDFLLEGEHFVPGQCSPEQLGRKAMAINLSDMAAMGGVPRYALVSLGLSEETPTAFVDALYEGLKAETGRFGAVIVGGNTARSRGGLLVDVTLLGEVEPERILRRSGGKAGDTLMVTGTLGDAAAGLEVLRRGRTPEGAAVLSLVEIFVTPTPRVQEGRCIALSGAATAMIDVSDGLAGDLFRLLDASHLDASIEAEALPLSDALLAAAPDLGLDPVQQALTGGEDYELLLAVRPEAVDGLSARVHQETGTRLTRIGQLTPPGSGRLLRRDGSEEPIHISGHDHLRREE